MLNRLCDNRLNLWQDNVSYCCVINVVAVDNSGDMKLEKKDKIYYNPK